MLKNLEVGGTEIGDDKEAGPLLESRGGDPLEEGQ